MPGANQSLARVLTALAALTVAAHAQTTRRVSLAPSGEEADQQSNFAAISADARFVAFDSLAHNLVPPVVNQQHLFVHDRHTGQVVRVSKASDGTLANGPSTDASISGDGRIVAFTSYATNLVPNDLNAVRDVFVHDRLTGETTRVSVSSGGAEGTDYSDHPSISGDGRFVAFQSRAPNLVANDTNAQVDIFVHDRQTGETSRVSVSSAAVQANDDSALPAISADGLHVAFTSSATNLIANDTNVFNDIYVHDRATAQTSRMSVSSAGAQANNFSQYAAISSDGMFVAFESSASNLVPGDTNFVPDIFVRDRVANLTTRASVDSNAAQGLLPSSGRVALSANGQHVAFQSRAILVPEDANGVFDIYVRDRLLGVTTRASVSTLGVEPNGHCTVAAMSASGRIVVFESQSRIIVPDDHNNSTDIFSHDLHDCPGDGNADGAVDFNDLNAVLSAFGSCAGDPAFLIIADINADNCVNFLDLNIVLGFFGAPC